MLPLLVVTPSDARLAVGAAIVAAALGAPFTLFAFVKDSWPKFSLLVAVVAVTSVALMILAISVFRNF